MGANMDIFLIGHSHLQAPLTASRIQGSIAKADQNIRYLFTPIDGKSKWQSPLVHPDGVSINQALGNALSVAGLFDESRTRILVSILAGNVHNATGLIQQKQLYDVIVPSRPDLHVDRRARTIPIEQFLYHFRKHYEPFYKFFKRLADTARPDRVYWVEPPPPIGDSDHIARNMDQWFKANYSISDLIPAPAILRYKLWLLNRMVLEEMAKEGGWTLITSPASAIDDDGFLTRQAWAGDATHGSAWYGEELLKKIKTTIDEDLA